MLRSVSLPILGLAIALIIAIGGGGNHLVVQGFGPDPERLPGPVIDDPPGEYAGRSFVRPAPQLVGPSSALSTFVVTYNGFPPQAQAAFQAAVNMWASQIQSGVPIRVTANWTTLAPNVLGSAGATYIFRDFPGAPNANTWFAAAVAKKLSGTDLTAGLSDSADIVANFNSSFGWYLGTDGNAGTQFDFMTVALHELGHGLGFFGSMNEAGTTGSWGFGGFPVVYDLFAINGSSQFLLNTALFPNPSAALRSQLVSNNIFFNGPNARGANGGLAPKLYAPGTWASGSSYSHVDESTYPQGTTNSLMTYALGPGEAVHDPGPIVRGMLSDMGWTVGTSIPLQKTRADFDGDRAADVLWRHSAGFIHIWFMDAATISRTATPATVASDWMIKALGDFNGDGKADVLWRHTAGTIHIWFMDGGTIVGTATPGTVVSGWTVQGVGDFNGDGKTDVLWRHATGTIHIWFMNGGTISGTATTATVASGWTVQAVGDFNGDGKADVLWRHDTGTIHIWFMDGSTISGTATPATVVSDWTIQSVGDFNGDGKADVLWRHSAGSIHIWFMSGGSIVGTATPASVGGEWAVQGVGDYNRDEKADILWRRSDGIVHIWFMNGAIVSGNATVASVGSEWTIQ